MIPVLHLHDVHSIHYRHLDTGQQICTILLLTLHLDPQRARDEDIALHQFTLISRHHHDPPCFSGNLDSNPEIIVRVPSEIDQVVQGVFGRGGCRS